MRVATVAAVKVANALAVRVVTAVAAKERKTAVAAAANSLR